MEQQQQHRPGRRGVGAVPNEPFESSPRASRLWAGSATGAHAAGKSMEK